MSGQPLNVTRAEFNQLAEIVRTHGYALQGEVGKVGMVAIQKQQNRTLYDSEFGLEIRVKKIEDSGLIAKGILLAVSVAGSGIGVIIGWIIAIKYGH